MGWTVKAAGVAFSVGFGTTNPEQPWQKKGEQVPQQSFLSFFPLCLGVDDCPVLYPSFSQLSSAQHGIPVSTKI